MVGPGSCFGGGRGRDTSLSQRTSEKVNCLKEEERHMSKLLLLLTGQHKQAAQLPPLWESEFTAFVCFVFFFKVLNNTLLLHAATS